MNDVTFHKDDVLDLALKYERTASLEGHVLYFVCDLLGVSSDTLAEMLDEYNKR